MQVVYTYLTPTGKKNGLFCLTLNALLHREEQSDVCEKSEKSHGLHQGRHPSKPFPAQIGHTERPQNVKGTMEFSRMNFS